MFAVVLLMSFYHPICPTTTITFSHRCEKGCLERSYRQKTSLVAVRKRIVSETVRSALLLLLNY